NRRQHELSYQLFGTFSMAARKRQPTLGNPLGARIEMMPRQQQPPKPQASHSSVSSAAPAIATAAEVGQASIDNIVTAVRMFSESLLTNRVSKEAQQEVKALAAQMEVLIARRRLSDSRSRSPNAAETRLALRNLKRFLEREAAGERLAAPGGKLQCVSCTTDTLESSCGSRIQAFSSVSDRTQSPGTDSAVEDEDASSPCNDGGGDGCRALPSAVTATIVENMRLRCCLHRQPHQASPAATPPSAAEKPQPKKKRPHRPSQQPTSRPPSPPPKELLGPSRQVQLFSSAGQPVFLLPASDLPDNEQGFEPASSFHRAQVAADFAEPNSGMESIRWFQAQQQQLPPVMIKLQLPERIEREPLRVANPQLEELLQTPPPPPQPRPLEVVAEQLAYEPEMLLTAEAAAGSGWCASCGRCTVVADKALVGEQGNQNCASVEVRLPIPGSVCCTVTATAAADASSDTLAKAANKIVSTCSCPSDSDAHRAEGNKDPTDGNKETMEESEDIQDSSALMHQQQQEQQHDGTKSALQHVGLQAAPVLIVQRVCETSSPPERLVSSASLLALMSSGVGGVEDSGEGEGGGGSGFDSVEDINWQQPLFRIADLVRQVRLAAPMTRSGSPEPVVAGQPNWDAQGVEDIGESNSTLEVLDQSGETDKAAAVMAAAAPLAPTWSSCELGQSSGFTKLLLTLDKAAKRRRDQALARRQRHKKQRSTLSPPPPTPQPKTRESRQFKSSKRSRKTSRSGNNSSCRGLRRQLHSPPPPPSASLRSLSEAMRQQQAALHQAAKSLSGLSRSLRHCVRQVQDVANAVNSTL
ncbi:hypothetical protein BOX15_Mlig025355g3, partial [Macrostomum lignano]